jgi:hypothetical protein
MWQKISSSVIHMTSLVRFNIIWLFTTHLTKFQVTKVCLFGIIFFYKVNKRILLPLSPSLPPLPSLSTIEIFWIILIILQYHYDNMNSELIKIAKRSNDRREDWILPLIHGAFVQSSVFLCPLPFLSSSLYRIFFWSLCCKNLKYFEYFMTFLWKFCSHNLFACLFVNWM